MGAEDTIAECIAAIREIEAEMLGTQDPAQFERLKAKHADARWRREVAEQRLAAEQAKPRMTRYELEQAWLAEPARCISRRLLSAKTKARLIGTYGPAAYRTLPR